MTKKTHNQKLTIEQAKEIKRLLRAGMMHQTIAKKFNVSRNTITAIKAGKSHREVY